MFELTARTFQGFEKLVAKELEKIGAKDIFVRKRTVDFRGDLECIYKANLHLRTATKVLKKISFFKAMNEQHLTKNLMSVDWSKYLTAKDKFSISTSVTSKFFYNSSSVGNKFRNCIIDHFKQNKKEFTPTPDNVNPDIRLQIQVFNEFCTIYIDSTGDFLFNRKYRAESTEKDLNEVLAAGMIMLSGWKMNTPLIDPMCGAGTIAFEAALMANNIAPGIYRDYFGFMKWKDFNKNLWEKVMAEAKAGVTTSKVKIYGYDKDPSMISLAKKSLLKANLLNKIHFEVKPYTELSPTQDKGFIVCEPPNTDRIDRTDILTFYERFGKKLKESFNGYSVGVLCPNKDALLKLGFNAKLKISLLNGKTDSFFEKYDIYQKPKKDDEL